MMSTDKSSYQIESVLNTRALDNACAKIVETVKRTGGEVSWTSTTTN